MNVELRNALRTALELANKDPRHSAYTYVLVRKALVSVEGPAAQAHWRETNEWPVDGAVA